MDKQKQIEEMAKVLIKASCYGKHCKKCAFVRSVEKATKCCVCLKHLYNAGYRKIPENAVVLTREEYEKLDLVKEMYGSNDKIKLSDLLKMLAMTDKVARKETAEKFSERLKAKKIEIATGVRYLNMVSVVAIDEICKEITEGGGK
jgi:hypothetical protein